MEAPKFEVKELEQTFYEENFAFIQKASLECFDEFMRPEYQISITEIPQTENFDFDHWVCAISVKLGWCNIGLKLHYRSEVVRELVASRMKIDAKTIPEKLIQDLVQEYLNLMMGKIKNKFGSDNTVVSLPTTRPTSDQEDPRIDMIDRNNLCWQVTWPDNCVYFACQINLETSIEQVQAELPEETEVNPGVLELF